LVLITWCSQLILFPQNNHDEAQWQMENQHSLLYNHDGQNDAIRMHLTIATFIFQLLIFLNWHLCKKNHSATCVETMKQSHFLERDGTKEVNATKSWLTACSPLIHEFRNNKNNKNKQTELLHFSLSTIVLNYCDNHFPSSVVECHYKFPMSYYLEASDQCKTVIIIIICQINFDWQFLLFTQEFAFITLLVNCMPLLIVSL
jgi:hypothetical protein